MSNFTPGPWNSHASYYPIEAEPTTCTSSTDGEPFDYLTINIAKGEQLIGTAEWNSRSDGWPTVNSAEECRANAYLMIGAPDQNAALELVLPYLMEEQQALKRFYSWGADEEETTELERIALLIKVVGEALAKAEGCA